MFIFFDIDDTLVNHTKTSDIGCLKFFDHFASNLQYSRNEFPKIWAETLTKFYKEYTTGKITFSEQRRKRVREVFNEPKLPDEEADFIFNVYLEEYEASWSLFDDVLPCLEKFNKPNLGIITNGNLEQQMRKLTKCGIADKFSVIVASETLGVSKPDPKIFLEACQLVKVEPKQSVYIGNDLNNDAIASAKVGMKAIWLCRSGFVKNSLPVISITSLKQIYDGKIGQDFLFSS